MVEPTAAEARRREAEERYGWYRLFQLYYQGDWTKGANILSHFADAPIEVTQEVAYDYNRLFVGPGKLLAPPYAGAYLNAEGLVMQAETIAVRNFYREAGLEVREKNVEPDDALALELEFICYLLRPEASADAGQRYGALYRQFFREHFMHWIERHLEDVTRNARTEFCRAVADAMRQFFAAENDEIGREENTHGAI